jgi:hypothetical protein
MGLMFLDHTGTLPSSLESAGLAPQSVRRVEELHGWVGVLLAGSSYLVGVLVAPGADGR